MIPANGLRTPLLSLFFAVILLSGPCRLFAQAPDLLWANPYGGEFWEEGYGGVPAANDEFMIVGYTESFGAGESDIYLVRVDRFGDTLWTRTYGTPGLEEGTAITQTAFNQGFAVVGTTAQAEDAPSKAWLLRLDDNGDTLWTYTWDNHGRNYIPTAVRQTSDGNFVVVGSIILPDLTLSGGWISVVDRDGNLLWSKPYLTPFSSRFAAIDITSSGFVVAGYITKGFEQDIDAWLLEMDNAGDTTRTRKFGGDNGDAFSAVRWNPETNAYACIGTTNSFGEGGTDMFFVELKPSAVQDTVRMQTYGGTGLDFGNALIPAINGGYILAGSIQGSSPEDVNIRIMRIDAQGDVKWTLDEGGNGLEEAVGIFNTEDGGYWIVGSTESLGSGPSDAWLLRLASDPASGAPDEAPTAGGTLVADPAPNPFSGTTEIQCRIDRTSRVEISVQDVLGRPVRTLLSEQLAPGSYSVEWNGTDGSSQPMPEGTYFCTVTVNGKSHSSRKIMLTR